MTDHVTALRGLLASRLAELSDAETAAVCAAIEALAPKEGTDVPRPAVREVSFVVMGSPAAQGSKSLGTTKDGRTFMREANAADLRVWRRAVRDEARRHAVGWAKQAPVVVELTFMFRGTRDRPIGPKPTAPDLDKLCRAVLDACTDGGMWTDDAQVVKLLAQKVHGETPGVRVRVRDVR